MTFPGKKPILSHYKVREFDVRTPKEVTLRLDANDRYGYPTTAIEGQENLRGWNKLESVTPRNLRSILP